MIFSRMFSPRRLTTQAVRVRSATWSMVIDTLSRSTLCRGLAWLPWGGSGPTLGLGL